jgi:hypothetical protein
MVSVEGVKTTISLAPSETRVLRVDSVAMVAARSTFGESFSFSVL